MFDNWLNNEKIQYRIVENLTSIIWSIGITMFIPLCFLIAYIISKIL